MKTMCNDREQVLKRKLPNLNLLVLIGAYPTMVQIFKKHKPLWEERLTFY